jgi:hypothetical protein
LLGDGDEYSGGALCLGRFAGVSVEGGARMEGVRVDVVDRAALLGVGEVATLM